MSVPDAPVNLYSDTQTLPDAAMRQAMVDAPLGDEQRRLDPTVRELEERVADLLGHEAGLFLPSGTMCNAIALRLHVRPGGDEVFLHRTAHPIGFEAGGVAELAGAVVWPLEGDGGIFSAEDFDRGVRKHLDPNAPRPRLVTIEQTTNMGGGRVWPRAEIDAVLEVAAEHGLRTHLDGARLFNASLASGESVRSYAAPFDSAWIAFSKGLGAPAGACLVGSGDFITEARRRKRMLGGAMRQGGMVAAAGLWALDHNVERLAEDHANAKLLADGLAEIEGVEIDSEAVQTNIVIFAVPDAVVLVERLAERGIEMVQVEGRVRAVTHMDVDRAGIERALAAVEEILEGGGGGA
jgi:threonine aldolase